MLKRFMVWLRGYLLVWIEGYSPERFLNLCSNHNILIWNISKVKDGYQFNIKLQDYLQLRPIVRKTKTMPYVKGRYGFPFLVHRYKKRKIFFVGVLIAAGLVYYMSLFIWDIEVSGHYSHTEQAIIKYLNTTGISCGVQKGKLNCQEIEENIRKRYPDIGWVSAEIRGTRLLLKLTETNMPKPYTQETKPCHIVADKDCIVESIVTRKGIPKVKEGQVVKKGDILVSGVVEMFGDDQTVVKKEAVVADADIIVKSFYVYKSEFSLAYKRRAYTSNTLKYYSLNLFGHDFYVLNPFKDYNKYKEYDQVVDESTLKLNKNFYLPFSVKEIKNREYIVEDKIYSEEEAIAKAKKELDLYIERLKKEHVEIIDNQVVTTLKEDSCVSEGKLIVKEPARDTRRVTEEESYVEPTKEPIEEQ